jgi:hypothetical protein
LPKLIYKRSLLAPSSIRKHWSIAPSYQTRPIDIQTQSE